MGNNEQHQKPAKRSMKNVEPPSPRDANSSFIPLSQNKFALVDRADFDWLNQWNWSAVNAKHTFYATRGVKLPGKIFSQHLSMHRQIMDAPGGTEVDHINGDGLDNRRSNLRIVTRTENMRSRKTFRNSKSGFKGVQYNPVNGRWKATLNIGTFDRAEEAARAYDGVARKLFGAFAKTNFDDTNES